MAKGQQFVHRVCEDCGFNAKIIKNWSGPEAPPGVLECPNCKAFTIKLRTNEWMQYAYWKGTLGPGRTLRESIKSQGA